MLREREQKHRHHFAVRETLVQEYVNKTGQSDPLVFKKKNDTTRLKTQCC